MQGGPVGGLADKCVGVDGAASREAELGDRLDLRRGGGPVRARLVRRRGLRRSHPRQLASPRARSIRSSRSGVSGCEGICARGSCSRDRRGGCSRARAAPRLTAGHHPGRARQSRMGRLEVMPYGPAHGRVDRRRRRRGPRGPARPARARRRPGPPDAGRARPRLHLPAAGRGGAVRARPRVRVPLSRVRRTPAPSWSSTRSSGWTTRPAVRLRDGGARGVRRAARRARRPRGGGRGGRDDLVARR